MKMVIKKRIKSIIKIEWCLIVLLSLISCQDQNSKASEFVFEEIEEDIESLINNPETKVIELSKLTPFTWDELYIFKPYTPIDSINKKLGFNWQYADKALIDQQDNFNLLVFTKEDKVLNYIKWPRQKGDFMKMEKTKYKYGSARFKIKKEKFGDEDWFFFYEKE